MVLVCKAATNAALFDTGLAMFTTPSSAKALSQEMVCFDTKSAWSIPLVLSRDNPVESTFASLLLMMNATMQILFTIILVSPEFLGVGLSEQLESARVWRRSSAHDVQYVDLSKRSLGNRVCAEDGSLIFSTAQSDRISEINSYLGLDSLAFELPNFQPGVLLSVLCILLWNICIFGELRSVWYVLRGMLMSTRWVSETNENRCVADVWQFSRNFTELLVKTCMPGLSWKRTIIMTLVCVGRAVVACALLTSGSIWLGYTTSISELMLNSVALEAGHRDAGCAILKGNVFRNLGHVELLFFVRSRQSSTWMSLFSRPSFPPTCSRRSRGYPQ